MRPVETRLIGPYPNGGSRTGCDINEAKRGDGRNARESAPAQADGAKGCATSIGFAQASGAG
jgi:hypothetical protein